MSLIVAIYVQEGIVLASDTRTTISSENGVRYKDDTQKIIPFYNYFAVEHCGNAKNTDGEFIELCLSKIRNQYPLTTTISVFPLRFLNDYHEKFKNTNFIIAGYDPFESLCCGLYQINMEDKTITHKFSQQNYGAIFLGCNDIANVIMKGIDYSTLSLGEAISLAEMVVNTTVQTYKYRGKQSVGGTTQMYVISPSQRKTGWMKNGEIVQDANADPDAYKKERLRLSKMYVQSEDSNRTEDKKETGDEIGL